MKKLYYSNGSPFARKVRIILLEKNIEFESDILDGLRPIEEFKTLNPALQVPVFVDGDRTLFGSPLIASYLTETYPHTGTDNDIAFENRATRPDRHWDDALILETIENMANTLVTVRLLKIEDEEAVPFIQRQRRRIEYCLDWLEERITSEGFWPGRFSLMDISLMCPLIYGEYRDTFDFRVGKWPQITNMVDMWEKRRSVKSTTPDGRQS